MERCFEKVNEVQMVFLVFYRAPRLLVRVSQTGLPNSAVERTSQLYWTCTSLHLHQCLTHHGETGCCCHQENLCEYSLVTCRSEIPCKYYGILIMVNIPFMGCSAMVVLLIRLLAGTNIVLIEGFSLFHCISELNSKAKRIVYLKNE